MKPKVTTLGSGSVCFLGRPRQGRPTGILAHYRHCPSLTHLLGSSYNRLKTRQFEWVHEGTDGIELASAVPPSAESEAAVPVQMELKRIIISEVHDQQVIMLKEVEGERTFPIVIGIFEATSIDRRVKNMPSPRPLTHDLVTSVIDILGGELRDIFISDLREHTYYAKLRIRMNGELMEVDSRPSDAIALAVTAKVPIYVAEDVLDEVCGED